MKEYEDLVKAIREKEGSPVESMDILQDVYFYVDKFRNYVNCVYQMEMKTPIIYAIMEGQELRDAITKLDERRRSAHEAAIAACSVLNRFCKAYGVKEFCPKTTDRYEIADFVGKFVNDVYLDGQKDQTKVKGIDDTIHKMKEKSLGPIRDDFDLDR